MFKSLTTLAHRYRHVNWALFDQAMVSGANFLTGVVLVRFLDFEEYGRFVLAWMAIEFVRMVQEPLVTGPIIIIGPKQKPETADLYYGVVCVSQFVLCIIFSVLLFAVVWLLNFILPSWNLEGLPLIMGLTAFTSILQYFLRRFAFTRLSPKMAFVSDAVRYLGQLGVLVVLFQFYELDAQIALVVTGVTAFLAVLCGLPVVLPIKFDLEAFRSFISRHWHYSKWLVPSVLLDRATKELFFATAGATIGAAAVGALRAAQNLVAVTHIILLGLENFAPIRASQRFSEDGKAGLTSFLKRYSMMACGSMAVIILIVAVVPEFWLNLIYGDQGKGQGYLVQWWGVIYLLFALQMPIRMGLRVLEYTRPIFWQTLVLAVISVAVCYPLVDRFGILGVMFGMVLIELIRLSILTFFFTKRLRTEA